MSEAEFDVMDELYFVQSYSYLQEQLDMDEEELISTLQGLWSKGWIKVLQDVDTEEKKEDVNWQGKHLDYFFLATKQGLLEHNTTG
jgi:hypothetical protein